MALWGGILGLAPDFNDFEDPPWKTICFVAQEELQRQQTERVAEERRQRAQELDDLARRAVTQMVSRPLLGYSRKLVEGWVGL